MDKDEWSCLTCGHCKYFKVNADIPGVESTCKRIDHKHIKLATPYFKAYDCGQFSKNVCYDFEPAPVWKWLYENWNGFDDYFSDEVIDGYVALCLENDNDTWYYVLKVDWAYNTFMDGDELLWIYKEYYKQVRNDPMHPVGYKLVREYNPRYLKDGVNNE